MGAVIFGRRGVEHARVVVEEVPAVDVVDVTIPVVIDPVARGLERVGPDVGREISVADVDAGVDDPDEHRVAADLRRSPRRGGRDPVRALRHTTRTSYV